MTDKEALEYIEQKQLYKGIRKMDGLEQLCQFPGNPQKAMPVIGIAGMSGRRSVSAYVATVLSNAGYRVGRYIQTVAGNERDHVRVNERSMTKQGFKLCLEQVKQAIEQMQEQGFPEPLPGAIETAIAYIYFCQKACDVAVWEMSDEVGSVQLQGVSTVLTVVDADLGVDTDKVKKIKYGLEKQSFIYENRERLEIGIGGNQEITNAVLAVEILEHLITCGFTIKESALRKGLLETTCRESMHVVGKRPRFIINAVENETEAQIFAETMQQYFPGKRRILMIGCLRTMEYDKIVRQLCETAEHIITVSVRNDVEGMHAYELAQEIQACHRSVTAADSPEEAVELAYLLSDKETVIAAVGACGCLGGLEEAVMKRSGKKNP